MRGSLRSDLSCSNICHNRQTGLSPVARSTFSSKNIELRAPGFELRANRCFGLLAARGPKPQTRENGIVMLADAVESSSRALSAPTPGSLRKLVHDMLMKRLLDGQFEESGLTLTELHYIEESLSKGLIALYHARIKYPEGKQHGIAS